MPSSTTDNGPLTVIALVPLAPEQLADLERSGFGPFVVRVIDDAAQVARAVAEGGFDCMLVSGDEAEVAQRIVAEAAPDIAILVVVAELAAATALAWWRRGAQDVLTRGDLAAPTLALRLRAAIERKCLECDARTAYATDLDTGLPHQQQLIEHMSQLLALRAREPAPMAVIALRIEGLATAEARLGREASNVLRRKLGVRLRAGVRASDVVASLGDDSFAVLLVSILAPADAQRVGAKLSRSLMEPLRVAGHDLTVATAIGIGQYPQDGAQPAALLRRAVGLAATAQAQGRAGFSNFGAAGAAAAGGAANDE